MFGPETGAEPELARNWGVLECQPSPGVEMGLGYRENCSPTPTPNPSSHPCVVGKVTCAPRRKGVHCSLLCTKQHAEVVSLCLRGIFVVDPALSYSLASRSLIILDFGILGT